MSEIDKLNLISNIGYIAAIVFLILAIVLFFVFDIKKIIMDKTGITEKRAIKRISEENQRMTEGLGVVTDKISKSGRINGIPITNKIPTGQILKKNETTVLSQTSEETTLLSQPSNETTVLSNSQLGLTEPLAQQPAEVVPAQKSKVSFSVVQDITVIHTDVVIG